MDRLVGDTMIPIYQDHGHLRHLRKKTHRSAVSAYRRGYPAATYFDIATYSTPSLTLSLPPTAFSYSLFLSPSLISLSLS
ncbi:hypothetical protein J6590_087569 [Homalodisca vitripennis]|nr:hypothetical protein J6590_087569 [Homalodisca vitripennis]